MLLVDVFLEQHGKAITRAHAKVQDRLLASASFALLQAVRTGEKISFAQSTMDMLMDCLKNYDDVIAGLSAQHDPDGFSKITDTMFHRGAWIEFYKPMKVGDATFSALFCFVPSYYLETGKDAYHFYLIDNLGDIAELLSAQTAGEAWAFDPYLHECRECERVDGKLAPCERCGHVLIFLSKLFVLCSLIASQSLAERTYEVQERTGMRRVQREKSKKERRIAVKHLFKVIDANEIIIPVLAPEEERRHEKGESWVALAQEENDLVYEEMHTRPFSRVYRHPRYTHMQGQTTDFPQGIARMQPRKKSLLGKHITKVKASKYETEKE